MKMKKIISVLLVAVLASSAFTACSKQESKPIAELPSDVVEIQDEDDGVKEEVDTEDTTLEATDKDGNVLTLVPIYHNDGTTMIAGYIEAAKDKTGKELDEKSYVYIKQVVALEFDEEGNASVKMTDDNKPITLIALMDDKGNIIALQDSLDLDKDQDTTEYFKTTTTADSSNNLFIRLDKDEKGNLVNVTVETKKEGDQTVTTVTTSDGKQQKAVKSTDAKNLLETFPQNPSGSNSNSNSQTNESNQGNTNNNQNSTNNQGNADKPDDNNQNGNDDPDTPDPEPVIDYTTIVLKPNGKIACDASNVTLTGSPATGGYEVVVDGPGEYSKYYVTSETDKFYGQIEFRFHIEDDVEVKFYNVNLDANKKTAIKFTDVDRDVVKDSDDEEIGTGGSIGSSVEVAAPKVELSFTGDNSFRANGSGKNGTIYSECKLAIKGHGSATIDGGQNLSGICSTESMSIKNATLNIKSSAKQGISCDKKVTINGGATINITSKGDGIHCNKFNLVGNTVDGTSTVKINSLYPSECADGIDTDDYIIISGGNLYVTALTDQKYALKVRKVIKLNPKGQFEINGGHVEASGSNNSRLTSCAQSTVSAKILGAQYKTTYTVDDYVSASGAQAFICSPSGATVVKNASGATVNIPAGTGNIRYADFY